MRLPWTRSPQPANTPPAAGTGAGLGTFGGVYTPSILTILGVIMYLRFGWVVGNVGLVGALVIVTLATSITFLTALSIATIATDRQVRAGGAYYMISRSLGVETGGAVGIPLFFAQAISVALYTVGFAESLTAVFPRLSMLWTGVVTTLVVAGLAITSARLAIRAQYFIMAAIGLSLLSFAFGSPVEATSIELTGDAPRFQEPFWVVFAVFFPAVTGIMAGVNMSGDLKDPRSSIPVGTLAAVGTGYLIYMILPVLLAMRADALTLIEDPMIMRRMALWGDAILLGVWGATLSSAMGSILGAPRVLQALARDGVLPRPLRGLGRGSGPDDAPRVGTIATLGVALVAVVLGDLNMIAPVLSMFFLTTYLVLNAAAGIEGFVRSPSFRPSFRVHWAFSLVGAVGCLAVMFLINAVATIGAAVIILGVYFWLQRREMRRAWGDVRRGIWMQLVREGILRLNGADEAKDWRPHPLVLSGAPTRRWNLIELAAALTHGRGLITVSSVLPAGFTDPRRQARMERSVREYLEKRGVRGLVRVIAAEDPFEGGERLVEAYGFGPLVPNTIILGDSEVQAHRGRYCRMVQHFHRARRNVVIIRDDPDTGFGEKRRIDVWWGGLQSNGGLMMLLAYLLRTSGDWQGADVNVNLVVASEAAAAGARSNLESILARTRIGATAHVLVADGRPFPLILRETSIDADLIFLGMAEPEEDFVDYYGRMHAMVLGLPSVAFVLAAQDLDFSDVLL
ncbi:MAG TPA: amino acid permease [Longimicrobiales bacterium]|nr:amino acid permease [Longimicrobiales bacterium]